MKRFFLTLLSTLFLVSFGFTEEVDNKIVKQMLDPVVKIIVDRGPFGDNGTCTGSIIFSEKQGYINNALILSAKHCLRAPNDTGLYGAVFSFIDEEGNKNERLLLIKPMKVSPTRDLMTFQLVDVLFFIEDNIILPTVNLPKADTQLKVGQKVYVPGHPLGYPKILTEGFVTDFTTSEFDSPEDQNPTYSVISANISPGNSGGGLFVKDENGDYVLVGVVVKKGAESFIGMAVSIQDVKEFLDIK